MGSVFSIFLAALNEDATKMSVSIIHQSQEERSSHNATAKKQSIALNVYMKFYL